MRLSPVLFVCIGFFSMLTVNASTVLITGANRGIGIEFAKQYAKKGYHVIGTARNPDTAIELKSLNVQFEPLDVTDQQSVSKLAKKLEGIPIDILINNAGIFRGRGDDLASLNFDEVEESFSVNSTGPLRIIQALLPNLRKGKEKKIVNISSQLGSIKNNSGRMYAYRASKAALNQISKTASIELGPEGFTCIVIHPGWVQTDMGGISATYTAENSVKKMINVIDQIKQSANGKFYDLNGNQLPW